MHTRFLRTMTALVAAPLLFCGAASANAAIIAGDTILIDFGRSNDDPKVAEDTVTTGTWNNKSAVNVGDGGPRFSPSTSTAFLGDLIRSSDGANTGVDLFFTADDDPAGTDEMAIGGADNPGADSFSGYPESAARDTMYNLNEWSEFELRDLDPALAYNLKFFGSVASSLERPNTEFDVDTDGDGTLDTLEAYDPAEAAQNGETGVNFAEFTGVVPNASGVIKFRFQSADRDSGAAHLNVMEINAIPEPASVVLVGLGAAMMLPRRRRA